MRNHEQIRARNALAFFKDGHNPLGKNGGNILSKLPSMIVANGLLAAAAFAKAKGTEHTACMANIFAHLVSPEIAAFKSIGFLPGEHTPLDAQIRALAETDSLALRRATTEAIAYSTYLKRFAPKTKDNDDTEN
jgi:CRISPR/Cas system CMR-associated protein Cmr5 small subunit